MHLKNVSAMKNPKEKVLVLGAGGVGAWVAKALAERGHDVFATTTNAQTVRALACLGIHHVDWRWEPGASWVRRRPYEAGRRGRRPRGSTRGARSERKPNKDKYKNLFS